MRPPSRELWEAAKLQKEMEAEPTSHSANMERAVRIGQILAQWKAKQPDQDRWWHGLPFHLKIAERYMGYWERLEAATSIKEMAKISRLITNELRRDTQRRWHKESNPDKPGKRMPVHFKSAVDVAEFAKRLGVEIAESTKSLVIGEDGSVVASDRA